MRIENGVLTEVKDEDIVDGKFEIPEGVTSIGDEAFSFCSSLKEITIPDSVEEIGMGVFYGCSSLKEITISEGVTSIG